MFYYRAMKANENIREILPSISTTTQMIDIKPSVFQYFDINKNTEYTVLNDMIYQCISKNYIVIYYEILYNSFKL